MLNKIISTPWSGFNLHKMIHCLPFSVIVSSIAFLGQIWVSTHCHRAINIQEALSKKNIQEAHCTAPELAQVFYPCIFLHAVPLTHTSSFLQNACPPWHHLSEVLHRLIIVSDESNSCWVVMMTTGWKTWLLLQITHHRSGDLKRYVLRCFS